MSLFNTSLAEFTPADVDYAVSSEIAYAQKYCTSHPAPTAILLAGQPGSGKTVLSAMLSERLQENAVSINADEYRRYHPNRKRLFEEFGPNDVSYTAPFSATVTEQLIDELSKQKYNLIIEGTGRTTEVPLRTAKLLTARGYHVEMAVVAVRPEVSLCSTLLRYYDMAEGGTIPRATAMEAHDLVVNVLPDNLDLLVDDPLISRLSIWTRDLDLVFDSEWDLESEEGPGVALFQYWNRPWSDSEKQAIEDDIEQLRLKEHVSQLGQMAEIEEVERRVWESFHEHEQSIGGITML